MTMVTAHLDFKQLPRYQQRTFVPENTNLKDPQQVTGLYQSLFERTIGSSQDLEQWLWDRSELESVLDQEGAVLYIKMTCQTDDPQYAQDYKRFVEAIFPVIKPLDHQLNHKYIQERKRFTLDPSRYEVYDRSIRTEVELFREENVSLQTQLQLLAQEYQEICGAMTVQFQGKEYTLPQMRKFLLEQDRSLRELAWKAVGTRRWQEENRLDDLFDQMLSLRAQVAINAGCHNYCEYQFRAYHRFDYTPHDCKKYHDTVAELVVPLWKDILLRRTQQMSLTHLRPWDLEVDLLGRPALRPFNHVEELMGGVKTVFKQMDQDLGRQFTEITDLGLLDLDSRKGKAPGGYQSMLAEIRKPFIFMNAVGMDSDVRTLLHEAGHAFHALASSNQPLFSYRHAPMEFCEVASMSMELLADNYLSVFYNKEEGWRSRLLLLEDIVEILVWVATIDAFQHWIYENPHHTRDERQRTWISIRQRFGGDLVDWQGLEKFHVSLWHRQLHIFESPFYYIEYGIAQLGALQLWLQAKEDFKKALDNYRRALALGGSRPLPELFATARLEFNFTAKTIDPLMRALRKELGL